MSRLKFRAWSSEEEIMWSEKSSELFVYIENDYPLIMMQSTGLVDKKGNEVFEGDIIRDDDGNLSKIIWKDAAAMFGRMYLNGIFVYGLKAYQMSEDNEVVGNIYETPEILETKDE